MKELREKFLGLLLQDPERFGMTEARLGELTGDHPENLTMDLPSRAVFEAGRRPVEVRGPFPELEAEILEVHHGFWD